MNECLLIGTGGYLCLTSLCINCNVAECFESVLLNKSASSPIMWLPALIQTTNTPELIGRC